MVLIEIYDSATVEGGGSAQPIPPVGLHHDLPTTGRLSTQIPGDLTGGVRIVFWVADRGPSGSPVVMYKHLGWTLMDLPRRDR